MQGWRIHMEDAHIAQPFLFAERRGDVSLFNVTVCVAV